MNPACRLRGLRPKNFAGRSSRGRLILLRLASTLRRLDFRTTSAAPGASATVRSSLTPIARRSRSSAATRSCGFAIRSRPFSCRRGVRGEAFLIQGQGSAQVEFRDGRGAPLAYDGRNGLLYASIGKILIEAGEI